MNVSYFDHIFGRKMDPRVQEWPLNSIESVLIYTTIYVLIVNKIGPKFMSNRKPFQLKSTIILYNAFQVLVSVYLFWETGASGWWSEKDPYNFRCNLVDFSNKPQAVRMAKVIYWYYISKYTELFDTFFFILRKKYNQVTRLHVIHHGIMIFVSWLPLNYAAGGSIAFGCLLNTFVHIIMYSYYFLAALGPQMQKYLWWKKYLTRLQMIQFILISIHFSTVLLFCPESNIPKVLICSHLLIVIFFLGMFYNFYSKQYENKSKIKS